MFIDEFCTQQLHDTLVTLFIPNDGRPVKLNKTTDLGYLKLSLSAPLQKRNYKFKCKQT